MMWNQDKYIKSWNFASVAHNGQVVPGTDIPYVNHIGLVAMEAMSAITYDSNIEEPDLLIQCALLHDVIEVAWPITRTVLTRRNPQTR